MYQPTQAQINVKFATEQLPRIIEQYGVLNVTRELTLNAEEYHLRNIISESTSTTGYALNVTLHGILGKKVNARAR